MPQPIIPGIVEIFGGPDAGRWPNIVLLSRQYASGKLGQLVVAARLGTWGLDDDSRHRLEVAASLESARPPGMTAQGRIGEPDIEHAVRTVSAQIDELGPLCVTGAVIAGLMEVPAFNSRALLCRTFGTGRSIISGPDIVAGSTPVVEYTDHEGGDLTVRHNPPMSPNLAQIILPVDGQPTTVAQIRF